VLNKGYGTTTIKKKKGLAQKAKYSFRKHWQLYLVIIPSVLYFVIFKYIPMFGTIIAFKDYNVVQGIWGSPWAGLKYFKLFFNDPMAWSLIKNTLFLSLYHIAVSFPLPILLALAVNEIRQGVFKKTVQMVTYAPYFISTVVLVSMIIMMTSPRLGVINHILVALGLHSVDFMGDPNLFRSIYVWSDAWQNTGYSAVVYLAALAGVDPSLYEAAKMDGASRIQKIIHIDLPGIMPAMVIILILTIGNLMAVGFEKNYLMQNPLNLGVSEILATYVFKMGLLNANYSLAAAVGLFNSLVNLILILISNLLAKRVTGNGLW
jgi:putative aldouronate transport system permease protein